MPSTSLKILQLIASPKAGGAETFYLRLVTSLYTRRKETGITPIPVVRANSWLAEQLTSRKIPHHTARFGGFFDVTTRTTLKKIIQKEKPHLAQAWMSRAAKFFPANTGVPLIARLGGYYALKYYKAAAHFIGNTQDICTYLKEAGVPENRITYLTTFIPAPGPELLAKKEAIRQEIRQNYDIPKDAAVLIAAGRYHGNKGLDTAIQALAHLPKNTYLILLGGGPLETELHALARNLNIADRVKFIGWTPSVTPFALASDIWLVPSRKEPLGNTVLDGWAHGLPVIAANAIGPATLIKHEKTGLLTPINDAQALAEAVTHLQADTSLAKTLAQNGKKEWQTHYSEEVVTAQFVEFYKAFKQS